MCQYKRVGQSKKENKECETKSNGPCIMEVSQSDSLSVSVDQSPDSPISESTSPPLNSIRVGNPSMLYFSATVFANVASIC